MQDEDPFLGLLKIVGNAKNQEELDCQGAGETKRILLPSNPSQVSFLGSLINHAHQSLSQNALPDLRQLMPGCRSKCTYSEMGFVN